MPLAPTRAMLQFSDCSPADGMNAAFKFTGLRQAPLAALQTGYTTLPSVGKGAAVSRDHWALDVPGGYPDGEVSAIVSINRVSRSFDGSTL
jgi:hypothetical protein